MMTHVLGEVGDWWFQEMIDERCINVVKIDDM
jgi:hypothetical protein